MLGDNARLSDHRIRNRRESGALSNSALHQGGSTMQDTEETIENGQYWNEQHLTRHPSPARGLTQTWWWWRRAPRRHYKRQGHAIDCTYHMYSTGQDCGAWMRRTHRHSPQAARFITIAAKSPGRFPSRPCGMLLCAGAVLAQPTRSKEET